jgi:hypothetical protein
LMRYPLSQLVFCLFYRYIIYRHPSSSSVLDLYTASKLTPLENWNVEGPAFDSEWELILSLLSLYWQNVCAHTTGYNTKQYLHVFYPSKNSLVLTGHPFCLHLNNKTSDQRDAIIYTYRRTLLGNSFLGNFTAGCHHAMHNASQQPRKKRTVNINELREEIQRCFAVLGVWTVLRLRQRFLK